MPLSLITNIRIILVVNIDIATPCYMMACLRTLGGVVINTTERGGASDVNAGVIGRVLEVLEDEPCLVRRLGDYVRVRVNLAAEVYNHKECKSALLIILVWIKS